MGGLRKVRERAKNGALRRLPAGLGLKLDGVFNHNPPVPEATLYECI